MVDIRNVALDPDIAPWWLIVTTFIQGIGMGFVFVPMNLVAFATLPAYYRTDGSALVNLIRNVGAAIGISITTTVLATSMQVVHSQMAESANPLIEIWRRMHPACSGICRSRSVCRTST